MKRLKKMLQVFKLTVVLLLFCQTVSAQCYPTQAKTAAFATGGSSQYKNQVLWLTWGSTTGDINLYPYGRNNIQLLNGSGSYASIDLGGGKFLCVEAIISNITGDAIKSYAPGNYSGDFLDDLYNIGSTGTNNKLVNGIMNFNVHEQSTFTVTCKATLNGVPVRLSGLVMGDAESLSRNLFGAEFSNATADGKWSIVEVQKNLSNFNPYEVRKVNVTPGTQQRMEFVKGNDSNTGAVSFLTFNSTAYAAIDYAVSFSVTIKGEGFQAVALGLLPPGVDGGDAPSTYGSPLHLVDPLALSSDGIAPVVANGATTNLNTAAYNPGGLVPQTSNFLGSVAPDFDNGSLFSKDALGDNNNGNAGINEEDAWPNQYKKFSYKAYYMPGNVISATIPYKGTQNAYISGWIDFNLNGIFENSELATVAAPASQTSVVLSWIVPATRVARSTYVRLRYAPNQTDLLSSTSYTTGGEVEDHRINILGPTITNPMLPSKARKK